ncbi:MAG TPA: Gfo/Idh/MocA family oxidoreductase, partial [Gemmatimonadaceae bacterium]|nr:Gfo/Idh/MocA family oxidoreductase [Gemmatimonadaceae bacterium]
MTSDKNFRIALAGCGRISKNHFDAIDKVDGLELVAVCDADPARAEQAASENRVACFTSYEKMLKEAKADVITIATPSGLHADQGVAAAQAGRHVVMEKPMAISLTGADALVQACDKAGVQL